MVVRKHSKGVIRLGLDMYNFGVIGIIKYIPIVEVHFFPFCRKDYVFSI
jgi:hypothetical protein